MHAFTATLIILSLLLTTASTADACSCAPPPPPQTALKQAHAVLLGKVTKIELRGQLKRVTFAVERSWKGVNDPQAVVWTHVSGAACGYGFQVGNKYVVYCYQQENSSVLRTNICTRTNPVERAKKDLTDLGPGKKIAMPGVTQP